MAPVVKLCPHDGAESPSATKSEATNISGRFRLSNLLQDILPPPKKL
jgi:hypothetical protein